MDKPLKLSLIICQRLSFQTSLMPPCLTLSVGQPQHSSAQGISYPWMQSYGVDDSGCVSLKVKHGANPGLISHLPRCLDVHSLERGAAKCYGAHSPQANKAACYATKDKYESVSVVLY